MCDPWCPDDQCVSRTDQVTVLEIETVEFIACLFGVVNVLINHECSSLGVVGDTLANLAGGEKCQIELGDENGGECYRMGPNLPKRSNSCSAVTL